MSSLPGNFWQLLPETDRAALREAGTVRRYAAGTILVREGDTARAVVVLLSGRAKVTALATSGAESVFALLVTGDIIGEMSCIDGGPCTATVTAIGEATGLVWAPERFLTLVNSRAGAAATLLRVVTARLRRSNRRQVEYGETTTATRLAAFLVDLAAHHGERALDGSVQITLQISQRDLGGFITASREAVARALRELREQGVVRTSRQQVTILRPDLLERQAIPR